MPHYTEQPTAPRGRRRHHRHPSASHASSRDTTDSHHGAPNYINLEGRYFYIRDASPTRRARARQSNVGDQPPSIRYASPSQRNSVPPNRSENQPSHIRHVSSSQRNTARRVRPEDRQPVSRFASPSPRGRTPRNDQDHQSPLVRYASPSQREGPHRDSHRFADQFPRVPLEAEPESGFREATLRSQREALLDDDSDLQQALELSRRELASQQLLSPEPNDPQLQHALEVSRREAIYPRQRLSPAPDDQEDTQLQRALEMSRVEVPSQQEVSSDPDIQRVLEASIRDEAIRRAAEALRLENSRFDERRETTRGDRLRRVRFGSENSEAVEGVQRRPVQRYGSSQPAVVERLSPPYARSRTGNTAAEPAVAERLSQPYARSRNENSAAARQPEDENSRMRDGTVRVQLEPTEGELNISLRGMRLNDVTIQVEWKDASGNRSNRRSS